VATRAILICNQGWQAEAPSGANRLASDIARALAAEGHEVHYLCVSGAGPYDQPVESDGVQVWRHPEAPDSARGYARLQHHLEASRTLAHRIQDRTSLDLVYGHTPLQYLGALDAVKDQELTRAFAVHSPYALEMRLNDLAREPRRWMRAIRQGMYRLLERRVLQHSDFVHGFSEYTGTCLRELYGYKRLRGYEVWPAWVDLDRFQPSPALDLKDWLGGPSLEAGERVFFTLRRLQPRMGLENLIDAAAALAQKGERFRLLIGGTGPLHDALQDRIALRDLTERVRLLGRLDDAVLPQLYAASDCFVLPTRGLECFGLIALEAWACGTPVIATPVGAIPELFAGRPWQPWLCRDASAEAIRERMEAFLQGTLQADPPALRAHAAHWGQDRRLPALLKRLLQV